MHEILELLNENRLNIPYRLNALFELGLIFSNNAEYYHKIKLMRILKNLTKELI